MAARFFAASCAAVCTESSWTGFKGDKMSQTGKTKTKRRWRKRTWVWILSASLAGGALLYWDQVAWLYVLSTLAVTILLLRVAFADLQEGDGKLRDTEADEPISAPFVKASNSRGRATRKIYSME
jgi:hypothetical protein